ncbi:MAG: ATP-grasp domain-containing protein [Ruminococcus sp.]|nr:ATP-grasp domain-containing protein [Ruminococcus sp.]
MINGKKSVLVLGANPETAGLVKTANKMGLHTIVTDYDPNSYAKQYAAQPCNIDASNVEELEELIKEQNVDAVLLGVAEALMPSYERICSDMNFPCYGDKKLFELFADKKNFKQMCREFDVPVVDEYVVSDYYSTSELKEIPLPVVVKPVDSCSSKGISVCKTFDELREGIDKALSFSKSKCLLIEKYMTGQEVVVYYVFQDGQPTCVGMCDRYTNKEQYGVAQLPTSYIFPSKHTKQYLKDNDEKVKNMFIKTGVKNGVMFIQSFIDEDGGVRFYEPGYRLNGAQEHYIVKEFSGIDAKELMINFALTGKMSEEDLSKKADPLTGKYGCKLSPLVKLGQIKELKGLDEIAQIQGVVSVNPSYRNMDTVTGYGTLKQIACRFFIVADTKEELKSRIDRLMELYDVIDTDNNSMLLTPFDTDIIINDYT